MNIANLDAYRPRAWRIGASVAALTVVLLLGACSGIPLRALPRLMNLQHQLLILDPAEFVMAIQVDVRMTPPPGAVPTLQLAIRPSEPGAFEAVDKKLAMHFTSATTGAFGLQPPPAGRRWLIYSLPPESQAELRRLQGRFRQLQSPSGDGKRGARVSIGIAQDGLAAGASALAGTRWETWLRTSTPEGFYEIWSGTTGDLLKQGEAETQTRTTKAK